MTVTAVFQVCHSWLDQESRRRKSIVTMKDKEDTSNVTDRGPLCPLCMSKAITSFPTTT
ncbi:hypothetical protein MBAV_000691 [Candidatus Magnetobacterium bavaricum]|uniref:Uncharacterized protein n=1 Tax=Candidatus Magnetobacterium bavaricum TaxID=29290 RepID=A0A0F3GYR2_9BACT|nr:hypothetical protein MBAV_000691 [Candidatus Magnetobacterium bavaricum]